jgi:hypothetical protein
VTATRDPILDALPTRWSTEPLPFDLEPVDCKGSTPLSRNDCAIARALWRSDPKIDAVSVTLTVAYVHRKGDTHKEHYLLPVSLQKVVATNDGEGLPETGYYELKPSAKRMAAKPPGRKGGRKGGAGRVAVRHISTRQR